MSESEPGGKQVSARSMWEHEALDFTPWLARNRNLNLLGEAVGLNLEQAKQEEPIGPFSLDVLAKEADSETLVAIENQLEWTDFGHFGKLLTYAAGCGAGVAIWTAPDFRYEHAEALHRLNEWTAGKMRFYGVKIEVLETSDSGLRPRFRKVVCPDGWNKNLTQPRGETVSPAMKAYERFFAPLVAELRRESFSGLRPRKRWNHGDRNADRSFPSPVNQGVLYMVALGLEKAAWVTLHIETDDIKLTRRIFDTLSEDRELIESAFAAEPSGEWDWRRKDKYWYSEVNTRRDGSIDDSPEKLDRIRAWMLDLLPRFKEVFRSTGREDSGGCGRPKRAPGQD